MVNNDNIKVKGLLRCCNVGLYHNNWSRTVESSWNVMAHGDAREGKWRGNWRMECVTSTLHTTLDMVYPALLQLMRTPRLPVVDWTDAPTDLNGLVRFAERRNLVSAGVPSHFIRNLLTRPAYIYASTSKPGDPLNLFACFAHSE